LRWAVSLSWLERFLHTEEVTGSNPVPPTSIKLSGFLPTELAALRAPSVPFKKGSDFVKQTHGILINAHQICLRGTGDFQNTRAQSPEGEDNYMKIHVEKPQKFRLILPVIIVLIIIGVVFLLPHLSPKDSLPSLAYEVTGFEGDVQITDALDQEWRAPKRGEEFVSGQKIRTGADGIINLQVEDEIRLRLKENALLANRECKSQGGKEIYHLGLDQGVLLGATTKPFDKKVSEDKANFMVVTPVFNAIPRGALFRVSASPQETGNKVGVLRGVVEIFKQFQLFSQGGYKIRGLEESVFLNGEVQPPTRLTPEAWQELKEGYDLMARSAAMEAEQMDLSKEAGSFFREAVFDHGTFFTPKMGFAGREFFKNPETGEVYLETEYDVFPTGSFVGVYLKTRDFDASRHEGLTFEIRRRGEEGVPDNFFIEFKSKGNVIRKFSPHGFLREWTPFEFKFSATKPTPINEVVFVFTNDRVGEAKKGMLEFRNFMLTPKKEKAPVLKTETPAAAVVAEKVVESLPAAHPPMPPKPVSDTGPEKGDSDSDLAVPQTISLR
jgi:hypothetical protein